MAGRSRKPAVAGGIATASTSFDEFPVVSPAATNEIDDIIESGGMRIVK